jgi:site-specific DNA recombinase
VALRLDGYVRVSRIGGRQGEGYIAPADQREAIESYAAELGGKIVAWHDDQDYSGGNIERPGFQAALERIRNRESDGIVVKRIDRFARSVPDGSAIVREIVDEHNAVFASCEERIDPRTPDGRYMLVTFLNNAELFLNRIKSGWWTAKARAVARGVHIGPTPIGYDRLPKGEERSGVLIPNPTYGPAISELFARASSGKVGDTALARWMAERAPREGGAPWQPAEIRRWLSNRVYLGEVHYGKLEPNLSAHEPLTDPATWSGCQRQPGVQRRAHSRFLLSGLIRCAHCRYGMGGLTYGGADHSTPVYRCHRTRNGGCEGASVIVAERIENYVMKIISKRLEGMKLEAAEDGIDLATLDREAEEAEHELRIFAADLNARRLLGEAGWQEALDARAANRDAKRRRRDEAYGRSQLVDVANVGDLDHDALRDLLDGMIRAVFVRRRPRGADVADRVLIVWSDDPRAIDVPGPHRAGPFKPIRW